MEMGNEDDIDDISGVCRTCLKENVKMQCIYEYNKECEDSFLNMLISCAPVKIYKGDGFSSNICPQCVALVENFFSFQQKCLIADKVFRRKKKLKTAARNKEVHLLVESVRKISENDIEKYNSNESITYQFDSQNETIEECTDYEYLEVVGDEVEVNQAEVILKKEVIEDDPVTLHYFEQETEQDGTSEENIAVDEEELSVDYIVDDFENYSDEKYAIVKNNLIQIDNAEYAICYEQDSDDIIMVQQEGAANMEEIQNVEIVTEDGELAYIFPSDAREYNQNEQEEQFESILQNKQSSVCPVPAGDDMMGHEVYEIYVSGSEDSKGRFLMVGPGKIPPGAKKRNYLYYQRVPSLDTVNEEEDDGKGIDDGPYECAECGQRFPSEFILNQHIAKHIVNGCNGTLCSTCNAPYSHNCQSADHKRVNSRCNFKCTVKYCERKFPSRVSRTNHILTQHPDEKPNMGADNGEDNYFKNKYPCSFCNKKFLCKSGLIMHRRTHTGEKPYLCADCGKSFATLGGLDLHQRRHTGERPYQCPHCNRGFAETSNLKVHIRSHTGEKPYTCSECGRAFARVFLLQLHMRTHTGEKPYECPYCKKAFRQQGDLGSHVRIHNGDRPHKCPYCDKGFIKSSGLNTHLKTHRRKDDNL